MRRRAFFSLIILTALISVGATLSVLQYMTPSSQGEPLERLVTFVVVWSPTPNPNATIPVRIITATPLPGQIVGLPTNIIEAPDLTLSPVQTINAEALNANPAAQNTVTSLPQDCLPHVIEEGDTPFGVAELYGVNGFTLMAVNGLTEETATNLQVGDVIIIPLEGCALEPPPTPEPTETPNPAADTVTEETEEPEFTFTPSPSPTITLAPTAANAQIEIVEVVNTGDVTAEAVRIRNLGNTVNVTGWTLSDAEGNVYTFPEQLIFSNAEITVYTRSGENTPVVFFWGRDEAVWGEPGDVITLTDGDGRVQATLRLP